MEHMVTDVEIEMAGTDTAEQVDAAQPSVSDLSLRLKKKWLYRAIKRFFDVIFAVIGLVVLAIPMAIIALIIAIESPGGAVFKQERLGKNGKPFFMYKFRTMRREAEADGPCWAEKHDSRCTKFGAFLRKSRLDELPQLWNILKGNMSFVGPRPERPFFYEKFEKSVAGFSNRLIVMPGLTGYAQVNGGYDLTPKEKLAYDMIYIAHCSLAMDLKCLLKTVVVVFSHKGAR